MESRELATASSSSSDDGEEDPQKTLIHHHHHNDKSSSATFQIEDNSFTPRRRRRHTPPPHSLFLPSNNNNNKNKRHLLLLLAILLPLLFFTLLFTTDLKSLFQSNASNINYDASLTRMRESELQALFLLRIQQSALLALWNHTLSPPLTPQPQPQPPPPPPPPPPPHSSNLSLQHALLAQISLNKQIQQALLSSHRLPNSLDSFDNTTTDPGFNALSNRCRKLDPRLSDRRTIDWNPKSNRYLFPICVSGQMSNHLICLEKHIFFAALLNRLLIIPSSKVDYEFSRVLDIDHINKCLGRKVVVTFEEFADNKKNHLRIDRVICYFSLPTPCFVDDDHVKKLKALGVSLNKLEPAWVEDVKKPSLRTVQDVTSKFSSDDDVIAIGDVFFANVEKEWVMQPGGPIAHKCKTLIEPSRLILLTAQRFVQTFLGEGFIALHFRRHGFLKFCNAKKPSCFFPIPQSADCINRVVERANAPVIYLSTDAAESETSLLQSLIMLNGKVVPLIKRPARNSAEKWDALLYRHGLEGDAQVEAMLDKTICALSTAFIGSSGSTFTEDILRLRKDWGSASLCDEYLCQGEESNFIAEDE